MTKKKSFEYSFDLQPPPPVQTVEQMMNSAMGLHQGGNLQQAEQVYRQILERQPKFAYALNMLGILISQRGNPAEGAKLIRKAIKLEPAVADFHINLGFNLQEQGNLEEAETEFERATRLDPDSADAWFNLGSVSLALKKPSQAVNAFRKTLEKNKNYLPAYNNLGNIYREMRRYDDALEMFNKVLELKPDLTQAWYNLGMTYKNLGDGENAVRCFEKVLAYEPANHKARCQTGLCRGLLLNDPENAVLEFDKVIESTPDDFFAYTQKSRVLQSVGRYDEAAECYRKILEIDQSYSMAYAGLVSSNLYTDEDVKEMHALLENDDLESLQKIPIHFALGNVYDSRQEFETAFHHFEIGNRLYRGTYDYDVAVIEDYVSNLIQLFDEAYINRKEKSGVHSEKPVFIVGMPRSGTTLVEQIIASHPRVFGAGEVQYIGDFVQTAMSLEDQFASADKPVAPDISGSDIGRLANKYLAYMDRINPGKDRITDKLPQNFLYLGYISAMFPGARIIHCKRNPLDVCLSIYTINFTSYHPYAYDLAEIAAYYKQYHRIMEHWESLLGDRILSVQYEDLVNDLESSSQKLVSHLGLEWDEHCMRFNETERTVQTTSHRQVRQNIYTTSQERWRNYEQWLGPLREALGKTV